jgi:transcriptional regulator with XRE-family HTH domain
MSKRKYKLKKKTTPPQVKWAKYAKSLLTRRRYINPWGSRILDLRMCLGWTQKQFAAISRIDSRLVRELESGRRRKYYPRLVTIKKVRLLEAAYRLELDRFKGDRVRWNILFAKGSARRYEHGPVGPPADESFIQALGGMAVFDILRAPRHRWSRKLGRRTGIGRRDTFPALRPAHESGDSVA